MHVSHDDIIKSLSIDEYMTQLQYMRNVTNNNNLTLEILCCTILTSMN